MCTTAPSAAPTARCPWCTRWNGLVGCNHELLTHFSPDVQVNVFVVPTDETWAGGIHPMEALQQYSEKLGIPVRLLVRTTFRSVLSACLSQALSHRESAGPSLRLLSASRCTGESGP